MLTVVLREIPAAASIPSLPGCGDPLPGPAGPSCLESVMSAHFQSRWPAGQCRVGRSSLCIWIPSQDREGAAGRKETNGRARTKSRTAVSERRSPQPRIQARRRRRSGCRRRNPAATAKPSSSDRNLCSGVNDSRPIWTRSAGRARMFRIQSVSWPHAEQMTTSRICGRTSRPWRPPSTAYRFSARHGPAAKTYGPRAHPIPGGTAATVAGTPPEQDAPVGGEAPGVAWLPGHTRPTRQHPPLSSPPTGHRTHSRFSPSRHRRRCPAQRPKPLQTP